MRGTRGQVGGPLTYPRRNRGWSHHHSHTTCSTCSCAVGCYHGSLSHLGWSSDEHFPNPCKGVGGNFSSPRHCTGGSLHTAVEGAATAKGRAQGKASRARCSPFDWPLLNSRLILATPGHLRPVPLSSPLVPRDLGTSSPLTIVHCELSPVPPLRVKRQNGWPWGIALPPPQGDWLLCDDPYDGQEGCHGDFVTCSSAHCPPVDNPRGRAEDLWRGGKMRPLSLIPNPLKQPLKSQRNPPFLSTERGQLRWLRYGHHRWEDVQELGM